MNNENNVDRQQIVNNLGDGMSVTLMAEIEERLAIEEALADFDLGEGSAPTPSPAFLTAAAEWANKRKASKSKNAVQGYVAQAYDAIDEYRKTPEGKVGRKLSRKERRHEKALAEGRVVKPRRSKLTDDERKEANAARQARHRATISAADQSADRQARRQHAKKREATDRESQRQAIIDRSLF